MSHTTVRENYAGTSPITRTSGRKKVVQAPRPHGELDAAVAHELADCLWSVLVLADCYDVDLQTAFIDTMATITESFTTE